MVELFRGDNFYYAEYNKKFHQILQDFGHIILGIFAGHSHMDSFKMVYKDGE